MDNWIIVGLGNPGSQYEHTRHNVGFWMLDQFAEQAGLSFKTDNRFQGELVQQIMPQAKFWLLKPLTFMNRSGQSVAALANFYKIPPERIVVLHDELDLPTGTVRLKKSGGHGGHNGLRDIIAQLGGQKDFLRCRIGIGHPGNSRQVSDYVLSRPSPDDRQQIMHGIDAAIQALPDVFNNQLDKAMNWLHSL
ncbi:Peptidyl-tRNA hydrolase [Methylophaga frappieri]|uniref:Peptidyl-tRNA hydrolase n=1 Tax=Methylophaga frappieri (strain ATCC BAA-2434 / DSM 25690 / JAM7) TaxID=754477 RepID=I1YJZ6_METFJ|nr:aminoacyl-tRNA hydrolase [Methylophaga frappieri]AFJ03239.1 Peptidyl-tRNA hydrolase [Methylophaga frappieri]